jgi:tetratricopeptide (TPR) repeat protein
LLALITLLAYLPVSRHAFIVYDDGDYVVQNKIVRDGLTWSGVKWAFDSWHSSNWHPLTWLSHMLDCELFGLNPGAHHLVNVLFHAANVVLLFLLLLRMTSSRWPAAIVAALFAWHPLHVESVAWVAERKDVLSTFFGLFALLAYVRYVREKSRASFWMAVLLFAFALMSKPMLVTLPFVLLVLDFWPLRRFEFSTLPPPLAATARPRRNEVKAGNPQLSTIRRLVWEKWPFFLLTIGSCVVTYLAQRARSVISLEQHPLDLRVGNALLSYGRYLLKTIWPTDLAIIYPLPSQLVWAHVAIVAVMLAVISCSVWLVRRRHPCLLVGWLWFLGTLVPVIGLVQVGRAAMADRYSYVPLIGVFIAVVYGVQTLAVRFRFKPAALGLVAGLALAGCLFSTERQLGYWRDDESLFGHAVAVTQNNATAHINLGVALEQQGRRDEALTNYQAALRIDPDSVEAHNDLANFLDAMGKPDEALVHYREALRLNPKAPLAHMNLGSLLLELGQFDEAMAQYHEAARRAPEDSRPHYLMGKAQLRQGRSAEAVAHFRDALRLNANDVQVLTWLARVLGADEKVEVRNGAEAVALAEPAKDLTEAKNPFVLDTLALAYAEAGRFSDAARTVQEAINISNAANDADALTAMRERLQLYQSGRPYRESFTKSSPK